MRVAGLLFVALIIGCVAMLCVLPPIPSGAQAGDDDGYTTPVPAVAPRPATAPGTAPSTAPAPTTTPTH